MKKFDFRLNQALRWRQLQLDLQKARLAAAAAARFRADAELAARLNEAEREHAQVRHMETGVDLGSWGGFRSRALLALAALEKQAGAARKAEGGEMLHLREADRKVRVLDRLRESQLAQWRKDFDRETEMFAGEAFLSRLQSRKQKGA